MRRPNRVARIAVRALPPAIFVGVGVLLFGAFDVMRRESPPAVMAVIGLGLSAVVFFTYFILGVARFRLAADGTVRVPSLLAWAVVLAVVCGVGGLAYLTLRTLPEAWR